MSAAPLWEHNVVNRGIGVTCVVCSTEQAVKQHSSYIVGQFVSLVFTTGGHLLYRPDVFAALEEKHRV